jgi:hypothetical protein
MSARLVAGGLALFGAGWFCGVANHVRRCWPTIMRLTRQLSEGEDCHDCATAVGRLSAELARETRTRIRQQEAADYYARVVAAQRGHIDWLAGRIDQLEHEQAIDGGTTIADEAQRFLADGGGS